MSAFLNLDGLKYFWSIVITKFQTKLTFDDTPTSGSSNPVKSLGIYTALTNKQDTMTAITNSEIDTIAV